MAEKSENKKTKNKKSSTAYRLRKIERTLKYVLQGINFVLGPGNIRKLEERTGFDINSDGKLGMNRIGNIFISLMIVLAISAAVYAGDFTQKDTDSSRTTVVSFSGDGDGTCTAAITGTLSVSETLTASGGLAATGGITGVPTSSEGLTGRGVARATYSFASEGGAVGAVSLGVTIPDNAIMYDGYIDVTSPILPMTNDTTIAIGVNAANDILAAVLATNTFAANGIKATVPLGTAASAVKATNALPVKVTIGTSPVTGGVFTVFLEYDIGD